MELPIFKASINYSIDLILSNYNLIDDRFKKNLFDVLRIIIVYDLFVGVWVDIFDINIRRTFSHFNKLSIHKLII